MTRGWAAAALGAGLGLLTLAAGAAAGGGPTSAVSSSALPAGAQGATGRALETRVIGRSVQGRPIVAERIGDPAGERVGLMVAVIHGDEPAGLKVAAALRRKADELSGVQVWIIDALNPDGLAARSRRNAHRVDLNRNFPTRWRGGVPISSGYYPGPAPASEPESRAAIDFISEVRPDVSVWYHQPWGAVLACRGRPRLAARYSKLSKLRSSCRGRGLRGTAIGWEKATLPGTTAFVVEFSGGSLPQRSARRHAAAFATIAGDD